MATESRTDVFEALVELSKRYPHWRLGQLLANVAGWDDADVWDVEDEQILTAARMHLKSLADFNRAPTAKTSSESSTALPESTE